MRLKFKALCAVLSEPSVRVSVSCFCFNVDCSLSILPRAMNPNAAVAIMTAIAIPRKILAIQVGEFGGSGMKLELQYRCAGTRWPVFFGAPFKPVEFWVGKWFHGISPTKTVELSEPSRIVRIPSGTMD